MIARCITYPSWLYTRSYHNTMLVFTPSMIKFGARARGLYASGMVYTYMLTSSALGMHDGTIELLVCRNVTYLAAYITQQINLV